MNEAQTQYAKSGDFHIAYQVFGAGTHDILLVPNWFTNVESSWDVPSFARFFRSLGAFARVVVLDPHGTGASDPMPGGSLPTVEDWSEDIRAVLDAVGIDRAAVVGLGPGSPIAIVFAATHPARTSALVLVNGSHFRTDGMTPEAREAFIEFASSGWGSVELGRLVVPSATEAERELLARHHRQLASPARAHTMMRMQLETDVRDALPLIQVPTLVIGRTGVTMVPPGHAQYLADHIADSKLVELPGEDYLPAFGDAESILDEIRAFVTGRRAAPAGDRVLATVLFTDIVGSTRRAAELGDRRWRELLASHHAAVRRRLEEFRGREVDTAGDGFLATFDGPGRAIRCVEAIQDSVGALGLEIRAGLHTGEIELADNGVTGIAVHIGARVAALAGPSEVLVTSTVKDLVVGSEIAFEDRGQQTLKGVPGEWRIYAVIV